MMQPWLGCIADDYTGATDLSSMLVRAGLRVVQYFGVPADPEPKPDADAVVIALKSRSIPPAEAVQLSLASLRFLQSSGCSRFFFKYCSTFDSTPRGNIGPVADALSEALRVERTLFCPAFPENGRTVHCGHLFVNGVPLHESGMKNHPLNPMTDSNLIRVLQAQSTRQVGLLGDEQSEMPSRHLIVDATDNGDLRRVANLAKHDILLTGGSAIAGEWARVLNGDGTGIDRLSHPEREVSFSGARVSCTPDASRSPANNLLRTVILAGSCSEATQQQVLAFASTGPVYRLDVVRAAAGGPVVADALDWCRAQAGHESVLVCSTTTPEELKRTQQSVGDARSAEITETLFGDIASGLVAAGLTQLIVAGGETSGAVIDALNVQAVRIGREIAPGVPWVHTIRQPHLSLVLKSGNFGGPRFFCDALELPA